MEKHKRAITTADFTASTLGEYAWKDHRLTVTLCVCVCVCVLPFVIQHFLSAHASFLIYLSDHRKLFYKNRFMLAIV